MVANLYIRTMNTQNSNARDYQRIEQALNFVAQNYRSQPSLAEIANAVHLSEYHFQRLFLRWAGVSPKQFLQYLTINHAAEFLHSGHSTADAAYEVGLSAPARLGELFVRLAAVTPGEFKCGGAGIDVSYGAHDTPFGECLFGITRRGICGMQFTGGESALEDALAGLKRRLPNAQYRYQPQETKVACEKIFKQKKKSTLPLLVAGTSFQLKVWEALLTIPEGGVSSYKQIASAIGKPNAVRAVGTAIGQNPISVLIPCHRVIKSDGMLGGYRWGLGRKLAIQGWEKLRLNRPGSSMNGR